MSGGHFEYIQYKMSEIVESIQNVIDENEKIPYENPECFIDEIINKNFKENGNKRYSDETIEEFKNGIKFLRLSEIYINRIDYLLSGDDSEDSFHKRLKKEILENTNIL